MRCMKRLREDHTQYFGTCTASSLLTKSSPVLSSSPATWQTPMAESGDEAEVRETAKRVCHPNCAVDDCRGLGGINARKEQFAWSQNFSFKTLRK